MAHIEELARASQRAGMSREALIEEMRPTLEELDAGDVALEEALRVMVIRMQELSVAREE